MNIQKTIENLQNCPCGREHKLGEMAVEIGPGLVCHTAEILAANNFPRKLLVVADKNTLSASGGILENLESGGFSYDLKLFDDLKVADIRDVNELTALCGGVGGVLSVGSGSLNDICRLASFSAGRAFAIFAAAPSMDGFASNSAPITFDNFKKSVVCHAPSIIIGDTEILAKAPAELKSAGFGDMIAKYIAMADWKIARLTVGEYYCPRVAAVTVDALRRMVSMAELVTANDPETAGAIMEALVMAGAAMTLAGCTRPASGAEHVISHFWEIKKLERRQPSDFHGKKVGVATLMTAKIYHDIANDTSIEFHKDLTDWDEVYRAYGKNFEGEVKAANSPTVTDETSPEILRENWPEIRRIIKEELPSYAELLALMKTAGAATTIEEIGVTPDLAEAGLRFHSYMRHRMTLMRLIPMLTKDFDYKKYITPPVL